MRCLELGGCQWASCNLSIGNVGGALSGVAFVGSGSAIVAEGGSVEGVCAHEFASWTSAAMKVGAVQSCTDGTGS